MTYAALLRRNPQFARLWAAMLISFIGDWFNTIALATLVSRYTEGSGLAISGLLLARFVPQLVVTPFAGAIADRFDRKRLLIISDFARVLVVLAMLLVRDAGQLPLLYVLSMIQFSLGALFDPARSALTPATVQPDDIVQANVLGSVTWSAALWLGALSGGLVAGTLGIELALVIDAASFLISGLFILSIRPLSQVKGSGETSGFRWRDVLDGLRYARRHPDVGATLLVKLGGNFGNVDSLIIIYATVLFPLVLRGAAQSAEQAQALSLGILYTGFGIGSVLGLLLVERLNDGRVHTMRRLIVAGYALITAGWLLFGAAGSLWIAAFAMLVKAIGSNTYWTYSTVILQKTVEDRFMGRMFSLDYLGFQLGTVVSTVATGLAIEAVGSQNAPIVVYATALVSLFPLVVWAGLTRWLEKRDTRNRTASQLAEVPGD